MKIINLTPHMITYKNEDEERFFPVSGKVARVKTIESSSGFVAGMPVFNRQFGELENVPESDGNFYIVSSMVKGASSRSDLIAPDTGSTAIRDEKGRIQAVTRWII